MILSALDKHIQSINSASAQNEGKESPEFRYRDEIESDEDSDEDRPRKIDRTHDQSDAHLGKRLSSDGNQHTPKKAFDQDNENERNRNKATGSGANRGLVAPPPPPREGQWTKEKKRQSVSLEQRYVDKKESLLIRNIPSCYNLVNHLTKYFQRFGNIVNVSALPKEKSAVIKYQREFDAKKAFECKDIPFNQSKIEIVYGGKVHSFEEDIRIEAEQRKQREDLKKARDALNEAKKGRQQNLTNLLNVHLELKQLVKDESKLEKLKEGLEKVRHELTELKNVTKLEELNFQPEKEHSTHMCISRKDGQKVDLKSINEAFKVSRSLRLDVWQN